MVAPPCAGLRCGLSYVIRFGETVHEHGGYTAVPSMAKLALRRLRVAAALSRLGPRALYQARHPATTPSRILPPTGPEYGRHRPARRRRDGHDTDPLVPARPAR